MWVINVGRESEKKTPTWMNSSIEKISAVNQLNLSTNQNKLTRVHIYIC